MNFRKRLRLLAAAVLAFAAPSLATTPAAAQFEPEFPIASPYAIVMDHVSGTVLFERAADTPWPPASMAKLMTMEIVFSEIKQGQLKLEDELPVSEDAWRRGGAPARGSTMFAEIHSRIPVLDLIQGAVVQSGNDACIVFAEAIAGNEELFARIMNERARQLGLGDANFANSTGLFHPEQKISVRGLAKLAQHLIRTYPEFYRFYGQREFTWNKIRQLNRNPLLEMSIGADGLKTGYIKESGYGLVGSAVQDGQRLIVVVNGAETPAERANDARRLLEWGFNNFRSRLLFKPEAVVASAQVFGGESGSVPLISPEPIRLLTPRNAADDFLARVYYQGPLRAPVEKGKEVARFRVLRGNNVALDVPLYTGADVDTGSMAGRALDSSLELVIGAIRNGLNTVLTKQH